MAREEGGKKERGGVPSTKLTPQTIGIGVEKSRKTDSGLIILESLELGIHTQRHHANIYARGILLPEI